MTLNTSKLLLIALLASNTLLAQDGTAKDSSKISVPKNWHLLDPSATGYQGIALDKAYELIRSKNLKSKRVTVAVIDTGIDTLHEDLKSVLWTNPNEIPGNGIDDDGNGYIDDVHGWNFLGGKDGRNVTADSYEAARVYNKLKPKWENYNGSPSTLTKEEKRELDILPLFYVFIFSSLKKLLLKKPAFCERI